MLDASENFEELNKLFTVLEKEPNNRKAIDSIFRITHTLKGNAMGMGYEDIASLSHVMEDVMGAIKGGQIKLDEDLFDTLFKANDKLGDLLHALESGEKVSYLGIKTKLQVMLKNSLEHAAKSPEEKEETVSEDQIEVSTEGEKVPEITFTDIIQIPVKKMDEMMNLVGQLIIERDRLIALQEESASREFESLQRITSNLQYSIMNARMVQMGFLFNKFYRIVRDAAVLEGKNVNLTLSGTEVEVDRNVLKIMSDSLIHLVRNSVGHGIESSEARKSSGKSPAGNIKLDAKYEKDNIVISVSDDGKGIDAEQIREKIVEKNLISAKDANKLSESDVINYIFEPGFSNAAKVTEISGRGVGMDVVKKAVESIGGQVRVSTDVGKGTTISLTLPSSLALKGSLLFTLGDQEFAVALSYTEAVVSIKKKDIHRLGDGLMAEYLESTIGIVFLQDLIDADGLHVINEKGALFKTFNTIDDDAELDLIVVSYDDRLIGIVIDRLLQQKEIIEKPLPKPIDKVRIISGTTILGNGNVCLVVDVAAVTDALYRNAMAETA